MSVANRPQKHNKAPLTPAKLPQSPGGAPFRHTGALFKKTISWYFPSTHHEVATPREKQLGKRTVLRLPTHWLGGRPPNSISLRSGLSLSGSHDFKQPARATNRLSKTGRPKLRYPRFRSLTNSSRILIVRYSGRFKKTFMIGFIHSDLPENVAWSVPGRTHSCASGSA
jgi:hypothetical protein